MSAANGYVQAIIAYCEGDSPTVPVGTGARGAGYTLRVGLTSNKLLPGRASRIAQLARFSASDNVYAFFGCNRGRGCLSRHTTIKQISESVMPTFLRTVLAC